MTDRWLPVDFPHPQRVDVDGLHHARPIRPSDVRIDYAAVMGSRARLWTLYGEANNWPRATMTLEQDEADLARHAREAEANESFNYAILDSAEQILCGCVYLDPPADPSVDAEISWWVTDDLVGTPLDRALRLFVPGWIRAQWPFVRPRFDPRSTSENQ